MSHADEPRIRDQVSRVKGHEYVRYVVDYGVVDGQRKRSTFKTLKRAKEEKARWMELQGLLRKRIGNKAEKLSDDDLLDAASALDVLRGAASLIDAARYYMDRRDPDGDRRLVREAIDEYMAEGREDGLRERSLQDRDNRLGRFRAQFGETLISDVTRRDVDAWLRGDHTKRKDGKAISPLSRKHYLTIVGGLLNFAVEQGYAKHNPLAPKTTRRRKQNGVEDERLPEIIKPAAVEAVMRAAEKHAPEMVPSLSIGFFAGVRTGELRKLEWGDVNLAARRITVPPRIAKKRSVRHIDIDDNLVAWLAPYCRNTGLIAPSGSAWRYKFDKVREKAKVKQWPSNAMRHCFATFYLLKTDDAAKTALQLGHRDTDLLFNHYRGLSTKQDAEKFWSIRPAAEGKVIAFPKAS